MIFSPIMWQGVPFNSNMDAELPCRDVNRNLYVLNGEQIEAQKNDDLVCRSGKSHKNEETKIINVEEDKETKVRFVCSKSNVSFTMSLKLDKPKETLKEDNNDEKELGLSSKRIIPISDANNEVKEENELGFLECQSNKKRIPIIANDEFYIGRDKSSCRIMVSCKKVSRIHARIESSSQEVFIRLYSKSSNMLINHEVIRPSPLDETYLIKNHDRIQIGPEVFVYLVKNYFKHEKNMDPEGQGNSDSVAVQDSESKSQTRVICRIRQRSDSIISGSTTEIKAKLINKDPALAMLNRKSPLNLIKTFEVESTEKAAIQASPVFKPIKETANEMSIRTKSKKKYLAKPKPPTPSIVSVSSNGEHVSTDTASVIGPTIWPQPKNPVKRQPFGAGLKFRGRGVQRRSYGEFLSHQQTAPTMANMWNTLEEISRDISQIQLEPETEDEKNSTQMKSKVETVKAVPATAEDEKSFSSRRKKNVIRGFKKRISPKSSSSEVKHEAETIDLRANSARRAGSDSTGSDMVIEKISIIKK